MTFGVFVLALIVVGVWWGYRAARAVAVVSRRIDADVAFMRSIPGDGEWNQ